MLHKFVLGPTAFSLLKDLMALDVLKDFYLVGGTALALQIGHRESIDLDLFCDSAFDQDLILSELPHPFEVGPRSKIMMGIYMNKVKTDFVQYPFPRKNPLVNVEEIRMADKLEIAAMKLWAITRRGSRKDFIDIYFLLQFFPLKEMIEFFKIKFEGVDLFMVLRSLKYFADAEEDPMPIMYSKDRWETMKQKVSDEVDVYLRNRN